MVNLQTRQFEKEIQYYGDTVTVQVISHTAYSKWGAATEGTANTTGVKCIVNDINPAELVNVETKWQSAEKRFFFPNGTAGIVMENNLIFNGITYEIVRVLNHTAAGITTYMIEAWCQRT